mgnify:CR=1 FL=1
MYSNEIGKNAIAGVNATMCEDIMVFERCIKGESRWVYGTYKMLECGKEISDTAKSCPHCGYKTEKRKSIFDFLNDTMNFVIAEIISVVVGIIWIFVFNNGKSEMLFWVKSKTRLGVEDAVYCIKNISKYTFMKNVGIFMIGIAVILCILMADYKFSSINQKAVEHEK